MRPAEIVIGHFIREPLFPVHPIGMAVVHLFEHHIVSFPWKDSREAFGRGKDSRNKHQVPVGTSTSGTASLPVRTLWGSNQAVFVRAVDGNKRGMCRRQVKQEHPSSAGWRVIVRHMSTAK